MAEEIIFGDVTTGASQDIKQATACTQKHGMKYGMSEEVGLIATTMTMKYLSAVIWHTPEVTARSGKTASIDEEVKRSSTNATR